MLEIFDAAIGISDSFHKQAEIKRLQSEIYDLQNECGSCKKWMTKNCHIEKSIKVSCGMSKCSEFEIDSFSSNLIYKKEQELLTLKK